MLILMHTSGLSEKFYKVFKITFIVSLLKSFYTENDISQILAKISYFILRMISVKYQPKTNIIKRFIFLTANKCPNTEFFLVHIFPYSVRIWTVLSQCLLLIETAFISTKIVKPLGLVAKYRTMGRRCYQDNILQGQLKSLFQEN